MLVPFIVFNLKFWRIFDQVCETSQGYTKRSQKEEEKEDLNRQSTHFETLKHQNFRYVNPNPNPKP